MHMDVYAYSDLFLHIYKITATLDVSGFYFIVICMKLGKWVCIYIYYDHLANNV